MQVFVQELYIDDIPIRLVKKPIKNLYIRINQKNGEVCVTAPLLCSNRHIAKFVQSKHDWIVKSQAKSINKHNEYLASAKRKFIDGETFSVWGKKYVLKNLPAKRYNIEINCRTNVLYFYCKQSSLPKNKLSHLKDWYKMILLDTAKPIVKKYENLTGLKSDKLTTRFTKSVWGTCQKKSGRIMLNANLAKLDVKFLDYIVLHEICHLKYSGHGQRFKEMQTKYLPNWKEISKELKEYSNYIADPYIV